MMLLIRVPIVVGITIDEAGYACAVSRLFFCCDALLPAGRIASLTKTPSMKQCLATEVSQGPIFIV